MKRRNWMGHHRSASRARKALGPLAKRAQSKRKSWTFEKLEDRYYFSATPIDTTLSSSTPDGAAAIAMQEAQWQALQATAMQSGTASQATVQARSLPTDPLFASQWHLLNTGQEVGNPDFQHLFGVAGNDINVVPVWNMVRDDGKIGFTGSGVVVAVIDTGVQTGHPDLAANISPNLQFNAITGSNNPLPTLYDPATGQPDPGAGHGTSVAGLLAASWNNTIGGTGVAPDATIVPIKLIGDGQTNQSIIDAFQYALDHGVDITNNSWGFADNRSTVVLPQQIYDVLRDSAENGRGGLGMINVFAAGNGAGPSFGPGFQGFGAYDSASYDPFINSRYVIGVTGVDHDGMYANADGTFTSYPEAGADVLVAAPTGSNVAQNVANDSGQGSGLWTTDLEGEFGFNAAPLPPFGIDSDRDSLADPNYTSRFNGTSGAAPIVSGIIALMLEANPNLTFRDVQEILVRSSRTTAWYESPSVSRGDVITGGVDGSGLGTGASSGTGTSSPNTNSPGSNLGAPGGGLVVGSDWGDAPLGYDPITDIGYRTTAADLGPSHVYDSDNPNRLLLGTLTDQEADGQPIGLTAQGDDRPIPPNTVPPNPGDIDDEDGVVGPLVNGVLTLVRGQVNTISVVAPQGGVLNVWIDLFGGIDDFGNPNNLTNFDESVVGGDHVLRNYTLAATPGVQTFQVVIPQTATFNHTFARFRLTSAAYLDSLPGKELFSYDPAGPAPNGEVEDYDVQITFPQVGFGGTGSQDLFTTWQTNQTGPFRDVDPYFHSALNAPDGFLSPSHDRTQYYDPLADPSIDINFPDQGPNNFGSDPESGNDQGRQFASHYELMPGLFANGAGYTVSQGYGAYADQIGYAHGVVDAELAVQMARQWNVLGQQKAPDTEKTVTTFVTPGVHVLAAEQMNNLGGFMLVPGGINGPAGAGYIGYWNEYTAPAPAPFDPASQPSWPDDTRGDSYVDFVVPPTEQMNVDWVEVKVSVSGNAANLNYLRLMLTSPDGTQSELNDYFEDGAFVPNSGQVLAAPQFRDPGAGQISTTPFVWTFSTNRNWGESTNGAVIINPLTGEPVAGPGPGDGDPIIRNWELHIENWGASPMDIGNIEIVWHGKAIPQPSKIVTFDPPGSPGIYEPLPAGQNAWDQRWLHFAEDNFDNAADANDNPNLPANQTPWQIPMAQRIQGSVGIDENNDGSFNYDRYVQEINPRLTQPNSGLDSEYSADHPRADAIIRRPDYTDLNHNGVFDFGTDIANQEEFASNIVVSLYRVVNTTTGETEATPTAYFLTGADGNFYFDVDPTQTWVIKITDPQDRSVVTDVDTPAQYMRHYADSWTITPDWFFAPDHDNDIATANPEIFYDPTNPDTLFKPGEIWMAAANTDEQDANGDGIRTVSPKPYRYSSGQFDDLGNPILNDRDPIPMAVKNINFLLRAEPSPAQFAVNGTVFADLNGDGAFNGDDALLPNITVYVDANRNGAFENGEAFTTTDSSGQYTLTVASATPGTFSIGVRLPGTEWQFKQPGSGVQDVALPNFPVQRADFALTAPTNAFPDNQPPGALGQVLGVVFSDLNQDGVRQFNEPGLAGVRVFVDTNHDFAWQAGEPVVTTAVNGSFVLDNIAPDNGAGIWIDVDIANEGTANATLTLTAPTPAQGGHNVIHLGAGGTVIGIKFGAFDRRGDDWGDLPNQTLAADNGPHHKVVPGFQLGATNSGEVNGVASGNSTADTDDGVIVVGGVLQPGVNTLQVTVNGVGGVLTGWMDFNGDLLFDNSEKLTWSLNGVSLGQEADLPEGTYNLQITLPASFVPRQIAARFRWGEPGLSFLGPAQIGEVEDYFFALNPTLGDYNNNGVVDAADFVIWKKQSGQPASPAFSGADGNGDGTVNQTDFDIWRSHFGNTYFGAGSGAAGLMAGEDGSQNSSAPAAGLSVDDLGGLVDSPSAEPPKPISNASATTTVAAASGSSVSSSSQFASFVADVSHSSSALTTNTAAVRSSSPSSSSDSSDLLLLDQTWATSINPFDHDDDSLYSDESHEIVSTNDLALAAVLKDDDDQWNTL